MADDAMHFLVDEGAGLVARDAGGALLASVPSILGQAMLQFALQCPVYPTDGSVPASGWYRNGDANGFSLIYIAPQS